MSPDTRKNRVLLVDDIPSNIKVLALALKEDHKLQVTTSGEDALKVARTSPQPDLILLDIMMPGMDGFEVCRRLKADPVTENIPVIFVTALNEEADEEKGLDLGAIDYITKPYSIPLTRRRVQTHLELKNCHERMAALAR
jgi:CheY-like chemotaxis protein